MPIQTRSQTRSQSNFFSITYPNGDVYEGELENGERNGKGKMTYTNGIVYEGFWRNSEFYEKGIITFPDDSSYL